MTWMSLLFAFSLGWAQPVQTSPFDIYVQDFIKESNGKFDSEYFSNVRIEFQDNLEKKISVPNAVGVCWEAFHRPIRIQIDRRWWKEADYNDRWQLIYHEAGHCVCGMGHPFETDTVEETVFKFLDRHNINYVHSPYLSDHCPKSLMHPTVTHDWCVRAHRAYYIKELFSRCRKQVPLSEWGKLPENMSRF